jgi:hypothetical protein
MYLQWQMLKSLLQAPFLFSSVSPSSQDMDHTILNIYPRLKSTISRNVISTNRNSETSVVMYQITFYEYQLNEKRDLGCPWMKWRNQFQHFHS